MVYVFVNGSANIAPIRPLSSRPNFEVTEKRIFLTALVPHFSGSLGFDRFFQTVQGQGSFKRRQEILR